MQIVESLNPLVVNLTISYERLNKPDNLFVQEVYFSSILLESVKELFIFF